MNEYIHIIHTFEDLSIHNWKIKLGKQLVLNS